MTETSAENQSLFGVVATQLQALHAQIDGESGDKIRAMGKAEGVLPDLVRRVLDAMATALDWLYKAASTAEHQLIAADAAVAALEVLADAIEAVGEGLQMEGLSQSLGLPAEPFEQVGGAIETGAVFLDKGLEIARLLPNPQDLRKIRLELEAQLGTRVNPDVSSQGPGALGTLIETVKVSTAA